jgi:hypothetical protein
MQCRNRSTGVSALNVQGRNRSTGVSALNVQGRNRSTGVSAVNVQGRNRSTGVSALNVPEPETCPAEGPGAYSLTFRERLNDRWRLQKRNLAMRNT